MNSLRLIVLLLFFLYSPWSRGQENDPCDQPSNKNEKIIWNVKAIHPDGYTMDVKAFDDKGNQFDVKALEDNGQKYIMDVKAIVKNCNLPIKVLVSEEQYKPVAAIDDEGNTYRVMAINREGELLEVRGVRKSGYIIHIKAISKEGKFYGVKAISREGKLNDVKGIKMYDKRVELNMNGVEVHAHVVALPQLQ